MRNLCEELVREGTVCVETVNDELVHEDLVREEIVHKETIHERYGGESPTGKEGRVEAGLEG